MGLSPSRLKVTKITSPWKATNIGYALWRKGNWTDSKDWFLRALELSKPNEDYPRERITAYRYLGWLSTLPKSDGLINPVGTLVELQYALKYWLCIPFEMKGFRDMCQPWSWKRQQIWGAILNRIQHNKETLLEYWVNNCKPKCIDIVNIDIDIDIVNRKLKLHAHELHKSSLSSLEIHTCDVCYWKGIPESFRCNECDFDVCMACYYDIDQDDVIYKAIYEYACATLSNASASTKLSLCLSHGTSYNIHAPSSNHKRSFYRIAEEIVKAACLLTENYDPDHDCQVLKAYEFFMDNDGYDIFSIKVPMVLTVPLTSLK
jgi:hypothetical protein